MAEDVTFVIHSEWLESIKDLPLEQQDRIIAEIVRYGAGFESQHPEDVVTQAFVNMVKGRINFSKNKYEQKRWIHRIRWLDNNMVCWSFGNDVISGKI